MEKTYFGKLERINDIIENSGIQHVFMSKKDAIDDMLKTTINDIADTLTEMNNIIYAILEEVKA